MLLNINPLAFAHLQQTPSNVTFGSRFGSGGSSGGDGLRWGRGVGSSGGGGCSDGGGGVQVMGLQVGGGGVFWGFSERGGLGRGGWFRWWGVGSGEGGVGSGGGGGGCLGGSVSGGGLRWDAWAGSGGGGGVGLRWGRGRVQVGRGWVQVFGLYCYQIILIIDHVVQLP